MDRENFRLKPIFVFAGALLVLAAVVGMSYVLENNGLTDTEVATPGPLVALPPKETFAAVFAPCAHCHQIGLGAKNSTGPVLTGVLNRRAASTSYPYSSAMRNSGLIWDATTLRAFLQNPHKLVPGTRMAFSGLSGPQITQLIDYIESVGSPP